MIGMGVARLHQRVGQDDLRAHPADHGHEPGYRFVEVGIGEGVGMGVGFGIGHARVAIAQHGDFVVADLDRGRVQLGTADFGEVLLHLGPVHCRVEDVALLAAGAAHERGADALVGIPADSACPLRRFIVGVSVNREN